MKFLLSVCAFVGLASSSLLTLSVNPEWLASRKNEITPAIVQQFNDFAKKYSKEYATDVEWAHRLDVFASNLKVAEQNTAEEQAAGGDAVFGVTKFMDLTAAEFKARFLTFRPSGDNSTGVVELDMSRPMADKLDWRTKNAVTKVKDQGNCGSCWAFSATEAIESYAFLSGKYKLMELSPQQITSCDKQDLGCNGGDTVTAYQYVQKTGGLETEADYPYKSGKTGKNGKCEKNGQKALNIKGHKKLAKSEAALKQGLNDGPVSICVAADKFQTYNSGILKKCTKQVDHCVQAVGYDDTFSTPYWLVRNSWAADWGEDGYIRIEQGKNLCKIDSEITFPTF